MSRPPPPRPRLDTTPKLPRDPSNWVDQDLLTYVGLNYSVSESQSAVDFIRHNRLTPQALWYFQTDPDALSERASEQSLREFILSLAQSVQPAVSPTTPRVKHVRRLSHDFEHPPPPPTPPPPSPSLPEEPELEEDDDVAESVISDWALDGDNDEIREVPEAPATNAEATPEPAVAQHAEPATDGNTLGLDIGGEAAQSTEPVEPPAQPAHSTISTDESLIDFEDAPETTSQASPEPSADATAAQPAEVDTAGPGPADPQVAEEPAVAQSAETEGASPSVNVPEATEEPPADAPHRDDPSLANEDAPAGAESSGGMPGVFSLDDDLGDPWVQHDESEVQVEPPAALETAMPEADREGERTDAEVEAAGEHEPLHSADAIPPASQSISADTTRPTDVEVHTTELPADANNAETGPGLGADREVEPEAPRTHSDSSTTQAAIVTEESTSHPPAAEAAAGSAQKSGDLDPSSANGETGETDKLPQPPASAEPVGDDHHAAPETQQDDPSAVSEPQATVQSGDNQTPTAEDASTAQQETSTPRPPSPTTAQTETLLEQTRETVPTQGDGATSSSNQPSEARRSDDVEEHKKPKIVLSTVHDAGQVDPSAPSLPVTPSVEDPSTPQQEGDTALDKDARKKAKKERQAADKAEKARLAAEAKAAAEREAAAAAAQEARAAAERKNQRQATQGASGGASSKQQKGGKGKRQRQRTGGKTETEAESPVVELSGGASGKDAPGKDDADTAGPGAEPTNAPEESQPQTQPSSDEPSHTTGAREQDRTEVSDETVQPSAQPASAPPLPETTAFAPSTDAPASPTITLANGDEMLVVVRDAGGEDAEVETPPPVSHSTVGESPAHSAPQPLTNSFLPATQSARLHEAPDRPRSSPLPAPRPQEGLRVSTAFPALSEQRRMRDSLSAHPMHTESPSTPKSVGFGWASAHPAKSRGGGFLSSVTNFATSFLGDSGSSTRNSSQEREREPPKTPSSIRSAPTSIWNPDRQRSSAGPSGGIAQAHAPGADPPVASPTHIATVTPMSSNEATTEAPTAPAASLGTEETSVKDGISEAIGSSCLVSQDGSADAHQALDAQTRSTDRAQGCDDELKDLVKVDLDEVATGEQEVDGVAEVAGNASAEHDRDGDDDENEPLANWVQVVKDRKAALAARSDEGSDAEDSAVEKLPSSPRRGKKAHLPLRVHELAGSDGDQSSPSTPTTTDACGNESNDAEKTTASSPGPSKRQRRKQRDKKK